MKNFADRLDARITALGNPICVGFDPRFESLPLFLRAEALAEFGDTALARAEAYLRFNSALITALADIVPLCKPQIAFYEELGAEGLRVYAETLRRARAAGMLTISDAKRGDIGATAEAYARAHLGAERAAFDADALTVSPYMGRDTLEPFLKVCAENGRGIFVLVKTSNAGSGDVQDLILQDGRSVNQHIAGMVHELGRSQLGECGLSSVGAVVGATYPAEAKALRTRMPDTPFLIPGYGAQGGAAADARAGFRADGRGGIVNNSRGLIFAFSQPRYAKEFGERDFAAASRAAALAMAQELQTALAS